MAPLSLDLVELLVKGAFVDPATPKERDDPVPLVFFASGCRSAAPLPG
jgi:hypothetical protein